MTIAVVLELVVLSEMFALLVLVVGASVVVVLVVVVLVVVEVVLVGVVLGTVKLALLVVGRVDDTRIEDCVEMRVIGDFVLALTIVLLATIPEATDDVM